MKGFHRGMTLTEVLVAGAILTIVTLAFFNGIILSSRLARENAEILQAEALAWDAVWMTFNEDYDSLLKAASGGEATRTVELASAAAPELGEDRYGEKAVLSVTLKSVPKKVDNHYETFILIQGDVAWGNSAKGRKALSELVEAAPFVYRSSLSRVETWK